MGPLFVIFFWLILFFIAGLIIGSIISFIIIPLIFRRRKTKLRLLWKFIITFVFAICLSVGSVVLLVGYSYWHSGDYYKYQGAFDSFRTPLVYPYQLSMIDVTDIAFITEWNPESQALIPIVDDIKKVQFIDSLVVGETAHEFWFIFDCRNGSVEYYEKWEDYIHNLELLKVVKPIELETVHDYYYNYWKNN